MDTIFKSFAIAKGDVQDTGEFSGYGSVFGVVDQQGDVVARGAFSKSLAEWRKKGSLPKLLAEHGGDSYLPVGKWIEMKEDSHGLFVRGKIANTTMGRDVLALMKDGAIDGLSIGCRMPRNFEFGDVEGQRARIVKELDLMEISIVTFPANEAARVTMVKSRRDVESILRGLGISERTAKRMASLMPGDEDDAENEVIERFKVSATALLGI